MVFLLENSKIIWLIICRFEISEKVKNGQPLHAKTGSNDYAVLTHLHIF